MGHIPHRQPAFPATRSTALPRHRDLRPVHKGEGIVAQCRAKAVVAHGGSELGQMPLKSILSVGLDPPTKSDKKGKDRAREKGMKGGKEERRRAERSEGKG